MDEDLLSMGHPAINPNELLKLIAGDPKLDPKQKESLMDKIRRPDLMASLLGGSGGSAIAEAIAKYMALDKTSQILLSLAGYGIGTILAKSIGQDQSHLVSYDSHSSNYKVHV